MYQKQINYFLFFFYRKLLENVHTEWFNIHFSSVNNCSCFKFLTKKYDLLEIDDRQKELKVLKIY